VLESGKVYIVQAEQSNTERHTIIFSNDLDAANDDKGRESHTKCHSQDDLVSVLGMRYISTHRKTGHQTSANYLHDVGKHEEVTSYILFTAKKSSDAGADGREEEKGKHAEASVNWREGVDDLESLRKIDNYYHEREARKKGGSCVCQQRDQNRQVGRITEESK
jgi:hypothetical protein